MDTPTKSPLDLALDLHDIGPARTHARNRIITECAPQCLPGENVSDFALRTVAEEYRKLSEAARAVVERWDTKALRMTAKARSLEQERDEARMAAEAIRRDWIAATGDGSATESDHPFPWQNSNEQARSTAKLPARGV